MGKTALRKFYKKNHPCCLLYLVLVGQVTSVSICKVKGPNRVCVGAKEILQGYVRTWQGLAQGKILSLLEKTFFKKTYHYNLLSIVLPGRTPWAPD